MFKNKYIKTISILLLLCVAVKIFSIFPAIVEKYYSKGLYVYISKTLRFLFGWLPFSVGDLLYTLFGFGIIFGIIYFLINILRTKNKKSFLLKSLYSLTFVLMTIYFLFNFLWGLNYNRQSISESINLKIEEKYSTKELNSLAGELISQTNYYRKLLENETIDSSFVSIKKSALNCYQNSEKKLPFLAYSIPSIKVPVYNVLGNYLGYSGYINPFTNEAQVNTKQPAFLLPFVVCHEMAHQVGYGSEDEANFASYLAIANSGNNFFKYSAYFQLYRYANNELFFRDSLLAKNNFQQLDTLVKQDIFYLKNFFQQYENPFEKNVTALYSQYLKANEQPQGLETYTQVTAWLLAYKKKNNKL